MTIDPALALARGRALAERATPLKLKRMTGALLALGRVAECEPFIRRAVNISAPVAESDMGLRGLRFHRLQDALAMSLGGWAVVRVAAASRVVGPTYGDYREARQRLRELGMDWQIAPYDVSAVTV